MALKTKVVKLSTPVLAFGKRYAELVLREPSGAIYFSLGPMSVAYRSGETESTHDLPGVFASYLERCTVNVDDPQIAMTVILADLNLEDSLNLRRTFGSFFAEAVIAAETKAAVAEPA